MTTQPGLRNGVNTLARLYDLQHEPALRDEMTYVSPTTGDRVGLSFITPHSSQDLELRHQMMRNWARVTAGMMGRTPDFLTSALWPWLVPAITSARTGLNSKRNIHNYYEHIRENDLVLTHTLVNLQRSRVLTVAPPWWMTLLLLFP